MVSSLLIVYHLLLTVAISTIHGMKCMCMQFNTGGWFQGYIDPIMLNRCYYFPFCSQEEKKLLSSTYRFR